MPSPSLHDIAFAMEYATREAREATFEPPSKRSKAGWPHKTPTASDLARAGFYYKPSSHSNDNTICFLCDRNLDGWEADDDPIQEHLKHAEDCGWAILMSIESNGKAEPSTMDDPTGKQITDARTATFGVGWPHEEKRGWACKTDKMVEAGWYFAPTAGSEDYVSCAYCKLSLDGWEPKDNPFEEHYSRSPNCPFFVFAGITAPSKRKKVKKGRPSKTSRSSKVSSRLSTQSNVTLRSEAPSIPDLDESIDTSGVSILSTMSMATAKAKRKAGTTKSKTSRTKKPRLNKSTKAENPPTESQEIATTIRDSVLDSTLETQHMLQDTSIQNKDITPKGSPVSSESPVPELGPPELPDATVTATADSPTSALRSSRKRISIAHPIIDLKPKARTPTPRSSPLQPSDAENVPPSTRPEPERPPLSSPGAVSLEWQAIDIGSVLETLQNAGTRNVQQLSDLEKEMTVQQWIKFIAEQAENELRDEGEKIVGMFEKEGQRALTVLEGLVCS